MVDIAVKKETVSLSEFMMHAVTKTEYDKESKVISKYYLNILSLQSNVYTVQYCNLLV